MNTAQFNLNSVTDTTATSCKGSQRRRSSQWPRVAVVALAFAIASAFVSAQGASASSSTTVGGSSGDVSGRAIYVTADVHLGMGMPRAR